VAGRGKHRATTELIAMERNYWAMELRVLNSTTSLAFEIVANDQDGMHVLQTIGEAAQFISIEFTGQRAEAIHWKHAAALLEAASRNSALVKYATESVYNLLETEGLLIK
jgi:uncharacterized protein with HEPN domain